MQNGNEVFETQIDLRGIQDSTIAQFIVHRNSYRSLSSANPYKFSVSLIYDKMYSDQVIEQNSQPGENQDKKVIYQMEIIGEKGTYKMQQTIDGIDKGKISIKIDLRKTWEATISINDIILLDLTNLDDENEKLKILYAMGSNQK